MNCSINELTKLLSDRYIRLPAVIQGEASECYKLADQLIEQTSKVRHLTVSDTWKGRETDHCQPEKIHQYLGQEFDFLIWDGFSGLSPSGIGAASGMVKSGGLFIFLLPPFDKLISFPDKDYTRLCNHDSELEQFSTYFLQHLVTCFHQLPVAFIPNENDKSIKGFSKSIQLHSSGSMLNIKPIDNKQLPTEDQIHATQLIEHVSQGHRNRPLVISADRGRGKSSALGIAAAELINEFSHSIIVTAPSKASVQQVFKHFHENINAPVHTSQLKFIAPDELCRDKPACHILFIDEAAAIPSSMLITLTQHYKRVVFSTTIHGYEGSGRGFAIRFKKYLDTHFPAWKSFHLSESIRWGEHDPLEDFTNQLLFLKPKPHEEPSLHCAEQLLFSWLDQSDLVKNALLLEQTVSLLVNAHYQTSPDDIRLILDHPKAKLGILGTQDVKHIVGVILLMEEGGIKDRLLNESIVQGRRRLRGHLVPQALATSTNQLDLLELKYLRVMRIAVDPRYQQQGLGTRLIEEALCYVQNQKYDVLSTSFGLNDELVQFWSKNRFSFLKLGIHQDKSTGAYSAILAQGCSSEGKKQVSLCMKKFIKALKAGTSRQFREHPSTTLWYSLQQLHTDKELVRTAQPFAQLVNYSEHYQSFEDSLPDILDLLWYRILDGSIGDRIEPDEAILLVARALQGRSITYCVSNFKLQGKKELDKKMREIVGKLIN